MDRPRDYHTKWSTSEKDHMMCLYVESKYDTDELTYET